MNKRFDCAGEEEEDDEVDEIDGDLSTSSVLG